MKTYLFPLLLAFFVLTNSLVLGQTILTDTAINWQDVEERINENTQEKNFFVFIYADWCDYCKNTVQTTLQDDELIKQINNDFIPVALNANAKDTIHLLNTDFVFDEDSGYHGLPIVLLEGNMTLPSYVFMTPEFTMISKISGHQNDTERLKHYLHYVSSNNYKQQSWEDYINQVN